MLLRELSEAEWQQKFRRVANGAYEGLIDQLDAVPIGYRGEILLADRKRLLTTRHALERVNRKKTKPYYLRFVTNKAKPGLLGVLKVARA